MNKTSAELNSLEKELEAINAKISIELQRQSDLNISIDLLRGSDQILLDLTLKHRTASLELQDRVRSSLADVKFQQKSLMSAQASNREAQQQLFRRNDSLTHRNHSLALETPKLQAELDIKDEVILNTTIKQNQSSQVLLEIAPNITDKELNLSTWTTKLGLIDEEIRTVNETLLARMVDLKTELGIPPIVDIYQFKNVSRTLNETFYNLTHVEEALVNSTNRTGELVNQFRLAEEQYFKKEQELKEYTKLVEAGVIPRVNFTFEY